MLFPTETIDVFHISLPQEQKNYNKNESKHVDPGTSHHRSSYSLHELYQNATSSYKSH